MWQEKDLFVELLFSNALAAIFKGKNVRCSNTAANLTVLAAAKLLLFAAADSLLTSLTAVFIKCVVLQIYKENGYVITTCHANLAFRFMKNTSMSLYHSVSCTCLGNNVIWRVTSSLFRFR